MVKWLDQFLGFQGPRNDRFPGQQAGEEVELLSTQHWVVMLPFFFVLSLLIALLAFSNIYFFSHLYISQLTLLAINSLAVSLLIHSLALRLFNYFLNVLIITNYRIIDIRHTVYLKRERDTIDLGNIQDIHFRRSGVWPRLLNYGYLELYGASTDVEYRISYVPDVEKIHSIICHIHRKSVKPRLA